MKHEMQTKRNLAVLLTGMVLLAWGLAPIASAKKPIKPPPEPPPEARYTLVDLGIASWHTSGINKFVAAVLVAVCSVSPAAITTDTDIFAGFTMDFVDITGGTTADDTGYGAVGYDYSMGVHEVSRGMIDAYNANSGGPSIDMFKNTQPGANGANIPATGVSWNEAARFVNWLNTSQGHSAAYKFTTGGANDNIVLWTAGDAGYDASNPFRNSQAYYFLPSEDEWYRAAFYDPTSRVYWDYATGSDTPPVTTTGGTLAGTAVYRDGVNPNPVSKIDITNAGGLSPFGTMAQSGNAREWTESRWTAPNDTAGEWRVRRGGDAGSGPEAVNSGVRTPGEPAHDRFYETGFRVASDAGPPNEPPTADAGPDHTVHAGTLVQLDGSQSSDDRTGAGLLLYEWSIIAAPAGSLVALSDPHAPAPALTADLTGYYVVQLIVTDEGGLVSTADLVVLGSFNQAPTSVATVDYALTIIGEAVHFDGSQSTDPDGDELDYAWAITTAPAGSTAMLAGADTVNPSLVPDVEGDYEIALTVNDGVADSEPDAVEITVVAPLVAQIRVIPGRLDLMYPGRQVTAIVTLPKGVSIDDLDPGEPWRLSPGDFEAIYTCRLFGPLWESAYGVMLYIVFDARQVKTMLWPGQVELSVYGRLKSGQFVAGTQSIEVTDSGTDPQQSLNIDGGLVMGEETQGEPGGFDRFVAAGEVFLQDGQRIVLPDGYIPAPGDTLRVSGAGGGLTGTVDELELPELPFGLRWITGALATSGELGVALETADTDLDGIEDGWEYEYFGGDCDGHGNPDGDPPDNHSEYVAGSDPTDPTSFLRITSMGRDTSGFTIEWEPCIGNRSYSVRWSNNPANGFTPLATDIEFPQNRFTDTVHAGERAAFYQIHVREK